MSFIVCGWYTPDYKPWLGPLISDLDAIGAQHEFVQVEKRDRDWSSMTLRKPFEIRDAMRRNPTKTVIFLDVDCRVLAPLEPLADIPGDVGVCLNGRADKKGRQKIRARSGTMVFKPTEGARDFVDAWALRSTTSLKGANDQTTLAMTLSAHPVTLTTIGLEWCAIPADGRNAKILHTSASAALGLHGWINWLKRAA